MKVTFLGTGTSQGVPVIACECEVCMSTDPRDKRLRSSILIEKGDSTFVIDTGPDFRQQMLREGVKKLDAVLFTHAHKDHIAGMDDIRAFNFKQKKDMCVYATEDVQAALRNEFHYVFAANPYPGIPRVSLNTISTEKFEIEGVAVQPIQVMHYKLPVLGFRIDNFAYITDAKTMADSEWEKLRGLDVLALNALRKEEHVSHLTLQEALDWIEELKPKRAYLTHISHWMGLHKVESKSLPDNVFFAQDGLALEL